jgi:Mg2+ and Co2+ transporter CorA
MSDWESRYDRNFGVLWLHIKDLRSLKHLSKSICMDYICYAGFYDLRAHSNVHATHEAVFMTLCTVHLHGNNAHLYKVYSLAYRGLLITFERDLLPDLSNGIEPLKNVLYSKLIKRAQAVGQRCSRLGAMHAIYEIAMEALLLSDEVLEYISRSVAYVKCQIDEDLSFNKIMTVHRTIHILRTAVDTLNRQISESSCFFFSFVDRIHTLHGQITTSISGPLNFPYLIDVSDNYRYRSSCLSSLAHEELATMLENLTAVRHIRSIKTMIDLALIATVFLPLTFIASVYGMNFQVDGGYSIPLLNYQHGPEVFWGKFATRLPRYRLMVLMYRTVFISLLAEYDFFPTIWLHIMGKDLQVVH